MVKSRSPANAASMGWWPALLWPAIGLVVLALLWPGLSGPFLFDDMPNLQHLAHVGGTLEWPRIGSYLASFQGNPGRPLAAMSFLINDVAWPSTPFGFKYTNLMLHLLAGLMAFGLARALVLAYSGGETAEDLRQAGWCGLVASAIWMVHPIQVSPVFLVVQRMTILSAIFVMAGLWTYITLMRRARNAAGVFTALATLASFTALAILCKENGALALLYAWVLHATVLRPMVTGDRAVPGSALARVSIPLAAILPFAALLLDFDAEGNYAMRPFTVLERMLTQSRVIVDYLHAILIPRLGGGGSIFHDDYLVSTGWLNPPATLLCTLLLGGLAVLAWRLRSRFPWAALAVFWFLAGHALESSFLSLELYFEHRNYLPLLGIAMAVAHAVVHAPVRWRRTAGLVLAAWLAMAAFVTHAQAKVWGNEVLLAEIWGAEHPGSSRAVQVRAKVRYERGDSDGARRLFRAAAEQRVGDANAWLYLLLLDCYVDRVTTPQAIERARVQIANQLPDYGTFDQLGLLRERAASQRCAGFGLAEWLDLSEAMLANPRRHSLDLLYYQRGLAFQSLRDFDGTIRSFETAYRVAPQVSYARTLAITFLSADSYAEALRWAVVARDAPMPRIKAWLSQRQPASLALIEHIEQARRASGQEDPASQRAPDSH